MTQEIKKPLSARTPKISKAKNDDSLYKFPEAKLDLEFFLKKGRENYTPDEIIEQIFGSEGFRLTEQEKVYNVLKAIEDIELIMPFEFECPHCHEKNQIAIEVAKVMKSEGTPKQKFRIEFDDYIFEFDRPEHIQETDGSNLADIGLFIMQWLVGHNQGKDFEFVNLKIGTIIKLVKYFSNEMFRVSFEAESKCAHCGGEIKEEFGVSMNDITTIINDL